MVFFTLNLKATLTSPRRNQLSAHFENIYYEDNRVPRLTFHFKKILFHQNLNTSQALPFKYRGFLCYANQRPLYKISCRPDVGKKAGGEKDERRFPMAALC